MRRSSGRAQVEPLAALAAVFALGVGLALYVGVLGEALPLLSTDRSMAPATADRLLSETRAFGAVEPPLDGAAEAARPTGQTVNATLVAGDVAWTAGPSPPDGADCAVRQVTVRVAPAEIRPGRLEVCVWPAP